MSGGRVVSNISGHNGPDRDPCPLGGPGGTVAEDESGDSCCEELAATVKSLTAQISALAEAISTGTVGSSATVLVRHVCLADGSPSLAYDIIPSGATAASEITTIYRAYPAEEGPCSCDV